MKFGKKQKLQPQQPANLDRRPMSYGTQSSQAAVTHGSDHEDTLAPDEIDEVMDEQTQGIVDPNPEQESVGSVGSVDTDVSVDNSSPAEDPDAALPISPPPSSDAEKFAQRFGSTMAAATHPMSAAVVAVTSMVDEAQRVAREAVERVLANQADERLFDTIDQSGTRFVVELQRDDIYILRVQWDAHNAELQALGSPKIPFSDFLARRLRLCRTHDATRPIYCTDDERRKIEEMFKTSILAGSQLVTEIDRRVRPILEFSNGETMRIGPLDERILERVPGWFPDKPPDRAISDFMIDATMGVVGY